MIQIQDDYESTTALAESLADDVLLLTALQSATTQA
jgi:hypothetical protein